MNVPLVSCLMVTKSGREVFARRAIQNFLEQLYAHKQLVIVAGTPEAFSGLPSSVKLVRAKGGLSLGGLRQQSVQAADGDLIATWDDDDESAPTRLAMQMAALGDGFACALSRVTLVCHCGFSCPSALRDQWEPTLIARRAGLPPYRDVERCEDAMMVDDITDKHTIVTIDVPALYRYHFHGGNASNVEHWQHIFEAAGRHHDAWKCSADRGMVDPEAEETFDDISKRIKSASSVAALMRVTAAVDRFRARHAANGPNSEERVLLAFLLASALAHYGEMSLAQVWALRALQHGPRTDVLCLLGEIAAALDEWDQAERWYESACGTTPRTPQAVEQRDQRYAELRQFARPVRTVRRQRADNGHVLAVMTCVGREKMLERTLDSLLGAGLNRWRGLRLFVSDGEVRPTPFYQKYFERFRLMPSVHGQARTLLRVFETAVECAGFTALTLVEDDTVLAKNALDYIASTEIDDDLALISWFTMDNHAAPFSPFLHVTNAAIYRPANQLITFSAATVRAVLASKRLHEWPEKHGADIVFREVPGKPCAVHYPNLAQHVGGNASLVGNVGERISPTFIGEAADALKLV